MAELPDANTNPWYVLMTLYGEQAGEWDNDTLHAKNRAVWNAWSCQGLDDDAATVVAKQARVEVAETRGWADMAAEVMVKHRAEMVTRNKGADFTYPGFPDLEKLIECSEIQFFNTVVLKNCIFTQDASFNRATFTQSAYFNRATFTRSASFSSATFTQDASFDSATFTQSASFSSATFTQDAYFISATFTRSASFDSASFERPAKFTETKFGVRGGGAVCRAYFTEAAFARVVSFREAKFMSHYPVLEGAQFREGLVLSAKATFWPDEGKGATQLDARETEQAKESCAALRHALAKQGMPEEEHFFFRREMEFTREVEWAHGGAKWPCFKAWPYWLFKVFSGYGESIALPVRALGELFLLGTVALFGFFLPTLEWFKAIGLAASMSFSNLLPLFGFSRTFLKEALLELPWGMQVLAGAQTVFALPLLFFLGLALRKRFRLR